MPPRPPARRCAVAYQREGALDRASPSLGWSGLVWSDLVCRQPVCDVRGISVFWDHFSWKKNNNKWVGESFLCFSPAGERGGGGRADDGRRWERRGLFECVNSCCMLQGASSRCVEFRV